MDNKVEYKFESIGVIHSCYKEKFGIPRQSGLVSSAIAEIEIIPPFNREEAFRGIEEFSHIWISFIFHKAITKHWKATVRPPRLGGNSKKGVFSTRSNFRPNPIGWSVVRLVEIKLKPSIKLIVAGGDFLDNTPILDIKPYIPYSDSIPDADASFASEAPKINHIIEFTNKALNQIELFQKSCNENLKVLITSILEQNPAPAYIEEVPDRIYGIKLYNFDLKWHFNKGKIVVIDLT